MTTKDAKAYLMRIRHSDVLINRKLQEVNELRERAMNIGSPKWGDKVQSSSGHDSLERSVVVFVDLEAEVQQEIKEIARQKREILKTLEELSSNEYEVLMLMYSDGLTIDDVASKVGRSKTWCNKTHGSALVNLTKVLEKQQNEK